RGYTHVRDREAPMIVLYLFIAMLGAAVAFFALQNPVPPTVTFFRLQSAQLPVSVLVLFSARVGVFLTRPARVAARPPPGRKIRYLERELDRERRLAEYLDLSAASRSRVEEGREHMPEHARL